MTSPTSDKTLRIGQLSRRVGVPVESLRAWELRYGLLEPSRTQGGFRLYSEDDVVRVLAMRANLDRGFSAAEAARLALVEEAVGASSPAAARGASSLADALDRFDETGAQRALDELLMTLTLDVALRDVLLPYLRDLGDRWARGEATIAQEHFASNLVRGRLMALARSWDRGSGPRAVLACLPGELHDLPLLCFGLMLRGQGWRISYLGADTPVASIVETARTLAPDAVVVSGTVAGVYDGVAESLREVVVHAPLFVSGAAADQRIAHRAAGTFLNHDVLLAAETLPQRPR